MLEHVRESVENLLGSLGATMTPSQRRRQLLLEAQAPPPAPPPPFRSALSLPGCCFAA